MILKKQWKTTDWFQISDVGAKLNEIEADGLIGDILQVVYDPPTALARIIYYVWVESNNADTRGT